MCFSASINSCSMAYTLKLFFTCLEKWCIVESWVILYYNYYIIIYIISYILYHIILYQNQITLGGMYRSYKYKNFKRVQGTWVRYGKQCSQISQNQVMEGKSQVNFHTAISIVLSHHRRVRLETDGSTEHRRSSSHDTAPRCCSQFVQWDQSELDSADIQHSQEHLTCYWGNRNKTGVKPLPAPWIQSDIIRNSLCHTFIKNSSHIL